MFGLIEDGIYPPMRSFTIGDKVFPRPYFLADGIYPRWAIFAKTIPFPNSNGERYYQGLQESCRKDVERLFGVLIQRFRILEHGCRLWSTDLIGQVMYACLIMHNMIIRHHKETNPGHLAEEIEEDMFDTPPVLERRNRPTTPSNDLDDLYESNPG